MLEEWNMFSIDDIKKKREIYERKMEDMLNQFEKDLPPEITIDNAVAIRHKGSDLLKCSIKLVMEDLNG
jgi:hypothetical protein